VVSKEHTLCVGGVIGDELEKFYWSKFHKMIAEQEDDGTTFYPKYKHTLGPVFTSPTFIESKFIVY